MSKLSLSRTIYDIKQLPFQMETARYLKIATVLIFKLQQMNYIIKKIRITIHANSNTD